MGCEVGGAEESGEEYYAWWGVSVEGPSEVGNWSMTRIYSEPVAHGITVG